MIKKVKMQILSYHGFLLRLNINMHNNIHQSSNTSTQSQKILNTLDQHLNPVLFKHHPRNTQIVKYKHKLQNTDLYICCLKSIYLWDPERIKVGQGDVINYISIANSLCYSSKFQKIWYFNLYYSNLTI